MTESTESTESTSRLKAIPWGKIAHVVGLLLLIAIVLPFVVYAVPQVVGANHGYVVLSGSMEPVMSPGDVVIVDSVDASRIEEGDIITFGADGGSTPTTHRVIGVTEQDGTVAFETKGDANEDADSALVTPDQIQGKVMTVGGYPLVIPLIGYVIEFASTQTGFVLLFAVPLVLFVLNEIWTIIAASRSGSGTDIEAAGDTDADTTQGTDASTTGDVSATEVTAEEPAESEASTESGGLTFTAAELQLGLLILGAFLTYSAWVAYDTTETWAFGVAGAVGASFLLLLGLYVTGGGGPDEGDRATPSARDAGEHESTVASATAQESGNGESSPELDIEDEMDIIREEQAPPSAATADVSSGTRTGTAIDGGVEPELTEFVWNLGTARADTDEDTETDSQSTGGVDLNDD